MCCKIAEGSPVPCHLDHNIVRSTPTRTEGYCLFKFYFKDTVTQVIINMLLTAAGLVSDLSLVVGYFVDFKVLF